MHFQGGQRGELGLESTASVIPETVRWARRRRASLLTEIRRAVASPASVLVCVTVIALTFVGQPRASR